MNKRLICCFILSLMLLTPGTGVFTQEKGSDTESHSFSKENWYIGISDFRNVNLTDRYSYLLNSLPLLLREELSDSLVHVLSEDETDYFAREYIDENIRQLNSELTSLLNRKDNLLFSSQNRESRRKTYEDLTSQIQKKKEDVGKWQQMSPDEIRVSDEMAIRFYQKEAEQESVRTNLEPSRGQTLRFMERNSLDMLISGSIERLDDLFFIQISCNKVMEEEPVFQWQEAGSEEELNSLIKDAVQQIRSEILGRSWTKLTVRALPESSLILLDGETLGVGSVTLRTLEPGFRTLKVLENGYLPHVQQIYLHPMGDETLEISLERGATENLSILSEPPGADVYFGSLWMGQTPLVTSRPDLPSDIRLTHPGYMSFHVFSDEIEGNDITVRLGSDIYSREMKLDQAKSAFYRSLGWFSLSIGVPLIMSGIYQNLDNLYYKYALDYNTNGTSASRDKAEQALMYGNAAYYTMWGGVALSGGLLINTLFKLHDYIKAAEESTQE